MREVPGSDDGAGRGWEAPCSRSFWDRRSNKSGCTHSLTSAWEAYMIFPTNSCFPILKTHFIRKASHVAVFLLWWVFHVLYSCEQPHILVFTLVFILTWVSKIIFLLKPMEIKKYPQIKEIPKHPREFCFVPHLSLWMYLERTLYNAKQRRGKLRMLCSLPPLASQKPPDAPGDGTGMARTWLRW